MCVCGVQDLQGFVLVKVMGYGIILVLYREDYLSISGTASLIVEVFLNIQTYPETLIGYQGWLLAKGKVTNHWNLSYRAAYWYCQTKFVSASFAR